MKTKLSPKCLDTKVGELSGDVTDKRNRVVVAFFNDPQFREEVIRFMFNRMMEELHG